MYINVFIGFGTNISQASSDKQLGELFEYTTHMPNGHHWDKFGSIIENYLLITLSNINNIYISKTFNGFSTVDRGFYNIHNTSTAKKAYMWVTCFF